MISPSPSNRIVQLTAAAEGKLKRGGGKPLRQMHDPLFPINSWTDEEVGKDQRSKLERELRDRGLLNNVYAIKHILAQEPATLPRPDTRSSLALPGTIKHM